MTRERYTIPIRLNLLTAATSYPVSLNEAKEYIGSEQADNDNFINLWIKSITKSVEQYTGLALMAQTWQMFMDNFPGGDRVLRYDPTIIEIPKAPLTSVTHIKHYDTDDVATTVATSNYKVSTYSADDPWNGRIAFSKSYTPPSSIGLRDIDVWEIQFICGQSDAKNVSETIKMAILQEIGFKNKNKSVGDIESESVSGVYSVKYGSNNKMSASGLSESTQELLKPFRQIRL